MTETPPHHERHIWRRLVVLAAVIAVVAALSASDLTHQIISGMLEAIRPMMTANPVGGIILFTLLSAVSAMVAFFSTAIIVPAAVYAWGEGTTFLLLWIGWLIGGSCAYLAGRTLGRRIAAWLIDRRHLEYYTQRISHDTRFATVFLFQLALPSEVPGYVLGTARYSFMRYIIVQAILELPWAIGAVYLGESFLEGRYGVFIAVGALGLLAIAIAARRFQKEMA